MTFFNSIMTCYKKSFDFKGRASKSEYWWFVLYLGLLFGLSIWLNDIDSEIVVGVYVGLIIGTVPAMFSVLVRRFHDVGLSTWSCIKRQLQVAGLSFLGCILLAILGNSILTALIALLWPFIGFLFMFIVLIGDSVYEDDDEEQGTETNRKPCE